MFQSPAQWERIPKRGSSAKVKHDLLLFRNSLVFSTIFHLSQAIFSFYSLIPLCHRLYPAENLQAAKKSGDLPEIRAGYRKPHSLLFRSRLGKNRNKTGSHISLPKTTRWPTHAWGELHISTDILCNIRPKWIFTQSSWILWTPYSGDILRIYDGLDRRTQLHLYRFMDSGRRERMWQETPDKTCNDLILR